MLYNRTLQSVKIQNFVQTNVETNEISVLLEIKTSKHDIFHLVTNVPNLVQTTLILA